MKYNFKLVRLELVYTIIYMRLVGLYSFFRWTVAGGEKMF
jgi:hypothetical protein